MDSRRTLFVTTALLETGAGLSLIALPGVVIRLLFGVDAAAPEALMVGRVGGSALLAIGVACWIAREDRGTRSQRAVLSAMLIYNVGACVVLAMAGSMMRMVGVALWAAVVLHAAMTMWCAAALRASR